VRYSVKTNQVTAQFIHAVGNTLTTMWQHLCSNEFVIAFVNRGSISPWTQEQRWMWHHCLGRIYFLCTLYMVTR